MVCSALQSSAQSVNTRQNGSHCIHLTGPGDVVHLAICALASRRATAGEPERTQTPGRPDRLRERRRPSSGVGASRQARGAASLGSAQMNARSGRNLVADHQPMVGIALAAIRQQRFQSMSLRKGMRRAQSTSAGLDIPAW